jgi:hypothetical protein
VRVLSYKQDVAFNIIESSAVSVTSFDDINITGYYNHCFTGFNNLLFAVMIVPSAISGYDNHRAA